MHFPTYWILDRHNAALDHYLKENICCETIKAKDWMCWVPESRQMYILMTSAQAHCFSYVTLPCPLSPCWQILTPPTGCWCWVQPLVQPTLGQDQSASGASEGRCVVCRQSDNRKEKQKLGGLTMNCRTFTVLLLLLGLGRHFLTSLLRATSGFYCCHDWRGMRPLKRKCHRQYWVVRWP